MIYSYKGGSILANLMTTVRQEMVRLRKDIAKQTAVLSVLTKELESHEKIAAMLGDRPTPQKRGGQAKRKKTRGKAKANTRTNWNALLESLAQSFTAAQVREAAGEASNQADVHQALLRWRKAGRVKATGRGKYRKSKPSSN
jgi:hypothetical protein